MIASKQVTPRLPIVGNVKIGTTQDRISRQNKPFKMPVKLDHFRFATSDDNREHPLAVKAVELFGEKPVDIRIVIPFDDVAAVLYTRRVLYGSTTWACKCDDGTFDENGDHLGHATRKFANGNIQNRLDTPEIIACPGDECEFAKGCGKLICKPFAIFSFMIPELTGLQGLWAFRTSSPQTISQLLGGLAMARTLGRGSFAGLPLHLVVRPKRAEVAGKAITVYLVSIEPGDELLKAGKQLVSKTVEQRLLNVMDYQDVATETAKLLSEPTDRQEQDNAEEFGVAGNQGDLYKQEEKGNG